jgi:hypothetical protein
MARILTATRDGLHTFDERGHEGPVDLRRNVSAIGRDGAELWAIVDRAELWHAPEDEWRHVATLEGAEATCLAMTDAIHVGSSGARLFRLVDGALEPVASFDAAEGRDTWYTPWGGPPATRSISEWNGDVYVNVHVGGILRTSDGGASWTPTIDIDADVHQVATAGGLVLAAGAYGLSTSTDRGATWSLRAEGLEAPYARAVVVCGDRVLVSASDGPRGGRGTRERRVRAVPRRTSRVVRRQHRHLLPGRAERRLLCGLRHRRRTRVRFGRRRRDVAGGCDRATADQPPPDRARPCDMTPYRSRPKSR